MSRDSEKNATRYISLGTNAWGPLLNGAAKISFHALIQADTLSADNNGNRMLAVSIANNVSGLMLGTDTTGHLRVGGRSVSGDGFQSATSTSTITADGATWVAVGGVFDIVGDAIRPYLNGVQEGGGAVTFGNASYTNGSHSTDIDMIGNNGQNGAPAVTSSQFDGRIAEVALWVDDLGAAGYDALNDRISPLLIRPEALVSYFRLFGNDSPERDLVGGLTATLTGAVAKGVHPRVFCPARPQIGVPGAAATGQPWLHYAQMRAA